MAEAFADNSKWMVLGCPSPEQLQPIRTSQIIFRVKNLRVAFTFALDDKLKAQQLVYSNRAKSLGESNLQNK